MNCDHDTCQTAYCPHCGHKIDDPLAELQQYVDKHAKELTTRHDNLSGRGSDAENLVSLKRQMSKWTRWSTKLAELRARAIQSRE